MLAYEMGLKETPFRDVGEAASPSVDLPGRISGA